MDPPATGVDDGISSAGLPLQGQRHIKGDRQAEETCVEVLLHEREEGMMSTATCVMIYTPLPSICPHLPFPL